MHTRMVLVWDLFNFNFKHIYLTSLHPANNIKYVRAQGWKTPVHIWTDAQQTPGDAEKLGHMVQTLISSSDISRVYTHKVSPYLDEKYWLNHVHKVCDRPTDTETGITNLGGVRH